MRMLLFSNTRGMHVIINESVVRWVLDKRKIMMPTTFVVGKRGATRSILTALFSCAADVAECSYLLILYRLHLDI